MSKIKMTYIIDDDAIFVFVLKKLLEKNGNFGNIIDFKNGNDAIDILFSKQSELPCVILLDLNMPIIDGWQFLDQLEDSDLKDQLNVYIMSSSIDRTDIEKSKTYSIVKDFISKPVNADKLNKILEEIN
ncbi:response regulator [Flavobacterium amniphilum]|uniref:response regulator n=1 Tax=Flavobacterium amniphilum TaxID=1834035 RepID=UPI002029D7C3|nr:response regulator [Flavobacterium amniphilum]MCL9807297.1 response regulator [Flavobacterium amniphilum]